MKKVFRIWKAVESLLKAGIPHDEIIAGLQAKWPYKCEGLTKQEMISKGYLVDDSWLVEEE